MSAVILSNHTLVEKNQTDLSDPIGEAADASNQRAGDSFRDIIAIDRSANTQLALMDQAKPENGSKYHSTDYLYVQDVFAPNIVDKWAVDVSEPFQPLHNLYPARRRERPTQQRYDWVYGYGVVSTEAAETSQSPTAWPLDDRNLLRFWGMILEGATLSTPYLTLDATILQDSISRTLYQRSPERLSTRLKEMFAEAAEEEFEIGMNSRFSRQLDELCLADTDFVLESLIMSVKDSSAQPDIIAELLQWAARQRNTLGIGAMDLFKHGLLHESSLVRDAAALSFADFDENRALAYLEEAAKSEKELELKTDLEALIDSLKS